MVSMLYYSAMCKGFVKMFDLGWGPFTNYVDKMRGEGVKKCLFLSTLRV